MNIEELTSDLESYQQQYAKAKQQHNDMNALCFRLEGAIEATQGMIQRVQANGEMKEEPKSKKEK